MYTKGICAKNGFGSGAVRSFLPNLHFGAGVVLGAWLHMVCLGTYKKKIQKFLIRFITLNCLAFWAKKD